MLFSLPVMYNCIYILSFLGFKDTSFANLASTSHVFDNVRMLPSKIPHPQPILSIPCRYSPVKLCILNLLFQCFADTPHQNFASSIPPNPLSQISSLDILWVLFTAPSGRQYKLHLAVTSCYDFWCCRTNIKSYVIHNFPFRIQLYPKYHFFLSNTIKPRHVLIAFLHVWVYLLNLSINHFYLL